MPENEKTVTIEGAQIIYKNFTGRESDFNAEGDRNFSVVLDPEAADKLSEDGWNVKCKLPEEEGQVKFCHLPVAVKYNQYPPNIVMITSKGRTVVDEQLCTSLDGLEFAVVDIIIRPYHYDFAGNQGIKAYLKTMFVTIDEDPLARKYAVPADD